MRDMWYTMWKLRDADSLHFHSLYHHLNLALEITHFSTDVPLFKMGGKTNPVSTLFTLYTLMTSFTCLSYIVSNGRMTKNDDPGKMWKELVMTYLMVIYHHFLETPTKKDWSGQLVSRPRFEHGTSRKQSKSINHFKYHLNEVQSRNSRDSTSQISNKYEQGNV
jgi:hypothetical protein